MKRKTLRSLALALVLLLVLPLVAFAGEDADATLKVALSGEPAGLYPQYSYNKAAASVQMCLYDTLVTWDVANKAALPNLATAWEWVDDTHLQFTLRDDVVFADGSPLTAEDVKYTFQVGGERQASSYSRIFDADNFEVVDDQTIIMALHKPYPTVMDLIGCDVYGIIGKATTEALGGEDEAARNPRNGSGKYTFVEWVDGQYITLERNDAYWNQEALPYYKTIQFTFISDATARAMAVESGDVDVADELPATLVEGLEGNDSLNVIVENTSTNRTIYMNCSEGPLADVRVREAIFWLVNPSAIRAIANAGYGELSETNFSQFCTMYAAPGEGYVREVDVEKAKALLADAGYADGLSLTVMMPSNSTNQTIGEIVQANLAEGGINVTVDLPEIGTFLTQLWAGDYEITITSGDQYDYAKLLYMVDGRIDPATASGGAQYTSDELIALLDKAYVEFDDVQRKEIYAEIQAYLRDNFVCIGICNELRIEATNANITGLQFNISGYPDFTTARAQ